MPEENRSNGGVPSPREIHWRRVLDRWKTSGLDGRAFCRREGLSEPSFYAWRRRIGRHAAGSDGPVEAPRPSRRPESMRLVPVNMVAATSPFEVILPGGRIVRVASDFDAGALKRLLDVLGSAAC